MTWSSPVLDGTARRRGTMTGPAGRDERTSVLTVSGWADQLRRRVSEKNRFRLSWSLSFSGEIVASMHKRKIPGSRTALHRFLERHGIHAQKKILHACEQERAGVARARRRWIREKGLLDSARLVFSRRDSAQH